MPSKMLERLLDGNKRYMDAMLIHPDQSKQRRMELRHGQHPFAVILGCADSRVPPEVIFDQGLGNLFVIRVAGNVLGNTVLASIEYAVLHLEVPLIVVLGHSQCGVVQAACSKDKLDEYLPKLTLAMKLAYDKVRNDPGDLINNVAKANARSVVEDLEKYGSRFSEIVKSGKLLIVPAFYDIDTGEVEVL